MLHPATKFSTRRIKAFVKCFSDTFSICCACVSLTRKASPFIAVVGGNDHLIERNVFHDLLLESFDSGAICAFAPALLMSMCSLRP